MSEPLELIVQATPNPNAIKVTLNREVSAQGTTYHDAASAEAEWAKQLLSISGVTQVFSLHNFVSVNKSAGADWQVLESQIEQVLRRAFA